jgi:hypothetical protein
MWPREVAAALGVSRSVVYNALDINTVRTVTQLSGRNFLRPRTIAPPRIAELAVSYVSYTF